jgi:NADPH:quinone reductase-like Zn-dependent oxidoreductase
MKAAIIHQYGEPDVLQIAEIPKPTLQNHQLLLKVHAASINPIDWKTRKGMLKFLINQKFPIALGFDVCGEVVEVGNQVTKFKPGDMVYGMVNFPGGAYAEYAIVSESAAAFKPNNMTAEEAAALPVAALTALQSLRDLGGIQPGQKVLINGGSGGVGTYAVQIAKAYETEVTAVCSGKNLDLVKSLGADRAIDYTQQDFTTNSETYDIVFDTIANKSLKECKKVLQKNGVYITTLPKPRCLLETALTQWLPGKKCKIILVKPIGEDMAYLKELIEAGTLHSIIDRTYPLAEIVQAHQYSEAGHVVGKIVITVSQ